MSEDFFCMLGPARVKALDLFVPWQGAWYADISLDDDTQVSRRTTLTIGTLRLDGTIEAATDGAFVLQRSLRFVAGAGAWGKQIDAAHYHDSDGVPRISVARDLARETGEVFAPSLEFETEALDTHFARRAGPASAALEHIVGTNRNWWVAPDGVTHVGKRPTPTPAVGSYEVLSHSPLHRTAILACDDPAAIWVGSVLTERFAEPQTIREFSLHIDRNACRITAYFGGDDQTSSRLGRALQALHELREAKRLYGTYRYRVYADPGDGSLSLQVVRPVSGLPDVLPVSMVAGCAGQLGKLDPGEIVRVAFDEGDPELPYVAHYPAGDPDKVSPFARMADLVQSGGPGTTIMFSPGPEAGGYVKPTMALGSPSGAIPVVVTGMRYLVTFGSAADLDPSAKVPPGLLPAPHADPLVGFILTGSDRGGTE